MISGCRVDVAPGLNEPGLASGATQSSHDSGETLGGYQR